VPSRAKSAKAAAPRKPKATKAKKAVAKRAAPKAEKPAGATLRVKQVKSGIGHAETYKRTLRALGLRHQAEIVVQDNPSMRGMLAKVHHLVRVTAVEA
jgi:large subunit ribosomal protein L30